jgi:cell division septal protein FtsQ
VSTRRSGGTRAATPSSPSRGPFVVLGRVLPSGRSLAIAFAVLATTIGAYAAARGTSLFAVRSIEVSGTSPAATRRVERALAPLAGRNLLALDAGEVDLALGGLRDVTLLDVDRAFPSTLRVTVTAERPAAVLRRGSESWVVSERGRILREASESPPRRLARIWVGPVDVPSDGALLSEEDALAPARALGGVLSADRDFYDRVREARGDHDQVDLVLRTGTEVRLGAPQDIGLKLAVAERILAALPGASGGYVDVSVPERAAARIDSQVSS